MTEENYDFNVIWAGRKCNMFGLGWTFTEYELTDDELFVTKGVFPQETDTVLIESMSKVRLRRTPWQKIITTGTVVVTMDKDESKFYIENVKDASRLYVLLSRHIKDRRKDNTIYIGHA